MLAFDTIVPSIPYILEGVGVTLQYTLLSITLGFIFGTFLALAKITTKKRLLPLRTFARFYTSIFRGTPLIVQLTIVYFATPQLTGYQITAFEAGVLAFSLNSGAYISEVIRGGILSVDRGQWEAAQSLGLSYPHTMIHVILPQAVKNILPSLVNEIINLLKESALVSVIGEADLLRRANIVAAEHFVYFEPLMVAALCYYVLVLALTYVSQALERKLHQNDCHS